MHTLTIEYPPEVLWALQQEPQDSKPKRACFWR